jgi:serine/threonine protein kinase
MADSSPQGAPLDRYVVIEYLSEGGMGAIYVGKKLGAGGFAKQVVLKQLLPEFTSQPEFKDLFLREARLSATLDHANIVHTIDLVTAGDDYFIVMEYLPGADLRTLVKKAKRKHRRFSPAAAIYITREVLSALAYAHAKLGFDGQHLRLIHRDVSPSNILISHLGEVKLTDFGIAKASTHNSVFYRVKGKIGYMSPEQAKSEELDHRSDLYSLAVCLYEMICGERLFVQAGLTTSAEEMYSQPIPLVSRKIEGVPAEFDEVMLKALHVDPDHRYQTAGEFQEALLRCAYRAGLMMSAPELAAHLRQVCGDPDNWREGDNPEDEVGTAAQGASGTEVYSVNESSGLLGPDDSDIDLISVVQRDEPQAPVVNERARRDRRTQSSMLDLGRLRHIELTSMINLAELAELESRGDKPLVDLDDLGGPPQAALPSNEVQAGFEITSVVLGRDDEPHQPAAAAWPATFGALAMQQAAYPVAPAAQQHVRRPRSRAWVILALILLLGLIAAAIVGLSGPQIEESDPTQPSTEPADTQPAAPSSRAADPEPAAQ